jgi:hypothetical protein
VYVRTVAQPFVRAIGSLEALMLSDGRTSLEFSRRT